MKTRTRNLIGQISKYTRGSVAMSEEQFGIMMEVYDARREEDPDVMKMREGVDGDRIVGDLDIETYYCEIKDVIPADNYLRVVGDNDFTDVEIRILHKTLNALGWTLNVPE